ncbi:hypothetical protein AC578_7980 [Pseudocercospora eumusae]|uniref:Uncharacterized protein n=1 Tax=Pseudocercospora eumusae TaxID=321146 RepID=A0A139HPJ9_9PEZI|nr:hypothetical protein AC578_7980 [Pseudocercospora eumusae]
MSMYTKAANAIEFPQTITSCRSLQQAARTPSQRAASLKTVNTSA